MSYNNEDLGRILEIASSLKCLKKRDLSPSVKIALEIAFHSVILAGAQIEEELDKPTCVLTQFEDLGEHK